MSDGAGLQEPLAAETAVVLADENGALTRVWRVLNRLDPIESLQELRNGLAPDRRPPIDPHLPMAIGFDTNAIYRVGLGTRGADALDYLRTVHTGPVVVPGQSVQEVWNNLLAAVEPLAKRLRLKFEGLETEMGKIGQQLGGSGAAVREAIQELSRTHGDWIDPASQSAFDATLDVLLSVGTTVYVPRAKFAELARIRKETKAPPDFQDSVGYGDFFVWADFLYGVALSTPGSFQAVVLVTNDAKSDWSRNGVPHPLLVAEASAIAPVPFRLWSLEEFHEFAGQFSS